MHVINISLAADLWIVTCCSEVNPILDQKCKQNLL